MDADTPTRGTPELLGTSELLSPAESHAEVLEAARHSQSLLGQLALRGRLMAEREARIADIEARQLVRERNLTEWAARRRVGAAHRALLCRCFHSLRLAVAARALCEDRDRFRALLQAAEPPSHPALSPRRVKVPRWLLDLGGAA